MVGGDDPFYVKFLVNWPPLDEIADFQPIFARSSSAFAQRCCTFHGSCTRPLATVPSPLSLPSGTCYHHQRSRHCRHCRLSSVHWRQNCFTDRTTTHTLAATAALTFTAALKFCLRLVSPWNSWIMMMMMMMLMMISKNRGRVSESIGKETERESYRKPKERRRPFLHAA